MIPFSALKELTVISAVLQRVEIFSIDRLIFSPRIFFGKFILVSFQIPILLKKNCQNLLHAQKMKHVDAWSCEHYFSYPWENVAYLLKKKIQDLKALCIVFTFVYFCSRYLYQYFWKLLIFLICLSMWRFSWSFWGFACVCKHQCPGNELEIMLLVWLWFGGRPQTQAFDWTRPQLS